MGFPILVYIATGCDLLLEPVDVENTFQCHHREKENSECASASNLVSSVDHFKSGAVCSSEYKLEKSANYINVNSALSCINKQQSTNLQFTI